VFSSAAFEVNKKGKIRVIFNRHGIERESVSSMINRDTREGWPLLTVETEVNWESKSANERGPSFAGLLGLSCRYSTRYFCSALAALVGPVQNIFSSPCTISILLSPSPSKMGRQPCWVACLSVSSLVIRQRINI
jgi:hypothetical protein